MERCRSRKDVAVLRTGFWIDTSPLGGCCRLACDTVCELVDRELVSAVRIPYGITPELDFFSRR